MDQRKRRSHVAYLCAVAFGLLTTPAWGQITGYQNGPGTVKSNVQLSATELEIAVRRAGRDLISVRMDAEKNRSKCPQEARRCIDACDRLESQIREARLEVAKHGYVTHESMSAVNAASEQYRKAVRDYSDALNHPVRPYRLPGWKIGKTKWDRGSR